MARPYIDLTGRKVGYLTVLRRVKSNNNFENYKWLCRCECGNEISVNSSRLNTGRIKSCGCRNGDNFRKHNQKHTRIYNIWCGMKQRCNSDRKAYKDVCFCEEWDEFMPFYEWAMANGYRDDLTLDRIDTFGNYEPSNCRWVTQKVQQNNRSNNTIYELNGEKHTLAEWEKITGISRSTISARILKLGWGVEKALTTPLKKAR